MRLSYLLYLNRFVLVLSVIRYLDSFKVIRTQHWPLNGIHSYLNKSDASGECWRYIYGIRNKSTILKKKKNKKTFDD